MTKVEILRKVRDGELRLEDAAKLLDGQEPKQKERVPPHFKVAINSGWCSVYFDGLRHPCTLPSNLWLELLEPENQARFRVFLEHNKDHFKNKE